MIGPLAETEAGENQTRQLVAQDRCGRDELAHDRGHVARHAVRQHFDRTETRTLTPQGPMSSRAMPQGIRDALCPRAHPLFGSAGDPVVLRYRNDLRIGVCHAASPSSSDPIGHQSHHASDGGRGPHVFADRIQRHSLRYPVKTGQRSPG
jgi:hypothetical protein